ncbi:SH3 domain-containing protein [Bartonella sp. B41]
MEKLVVFFAFVSLFLSVTSAKSTNAIVVRNLNFRVGPSIQYELRGLIPAGQSIFVKFCRNNWCNVKYNTQTGWVSSRYLSFRNSDDLYHTYKIVPNT